MVRIDGTKFSPLFEHVRRSRPVTAGRIAPHSQQITAVAAHFSRLSAPMYAHEKVMLSAVGDSILGLTVVDMRYLRCEQAFDRRSLLRSRRHTHARRGEGPWHPSTLPAALMRGCATSFRQNESHLAALTVLHFGKPRERPPGATVHFAGMIPTMDPVVRYTVVTRALRHAE